MKLADIEVGKTYRMGGGFPWYGAKVTVVKGPGIESALTEVAAGSWPRRRNPPRGWLVRVVAVKPRAQARFAREVGAEWFAASRELEAEWSEADEARLADEVTHAERVQALRRRVDSDRDFSVTDGGMLLTHDVEASERLLDRLDKVPVVTASGRVLTDEDFERLADEAEQGHEAAS